MSNAEYIASRIAADAKANPQIPTSAWLGHWAQLLSIVRNKGRDRDRISFDPATTYHYNG